MFTNGTIFPICYWSGLILALFTGSAPPGPSSSRSTPDLLNKINNLFGSDEEKPKLRNSRDVRKVADNLGQSYQYFKDKHSKADNDEGRNKVGVKGQNKTTIAALT